MALNGKTAVTTAEGVAIQFGDALSKFIVAHPKILGAWRTGDRAGAATGHCRAALTAAGADQWPHPEWAFCPPAAWADQPSASCWPRRSACRRCGWTTPGMTRPWLKAALIDPTIEGRQGHAGASTRQPSRTSTRPAPPMEGDAERRHCDAGRTPRSRRRATPTPRPAPLPKSPSRACPGASRLGRPRAQKAISGPIAEADACARQYELRQDLPGGVGAVTAARVFFCEPAGRSGLGRRHADGPCLGHGRFAPHLSASAVSPSTSSSARPSGDLGLTRTRAGRRPGGCGRPFEDGHNPPSAAHLPIAPGQRAGVHA